MFFVFVVASTYSRGVLAMSGNETVNLDTNSDGPDVQNFVFHSAPPLCCDVDLEHKFDLKAKPFDDEQPDNTESFIKISTDSVLDMNWETALNKVNTSVRDALMTVPVLRYPIENLEIKLRLLKVHF